MGTTTRPAPSPTVDWASGIRGLLFSLCLAGIASSSGQGWMLIPASGFALYSVFVPLGAADFITSRAFRIAVIRAAVLGSLAMTAAVLCAAMVNTPVPAVSVAGGVAMIGLFVTVTLSTALTSARWVIRGVRTLWPTLSPHPATSRIDLLVVALRLQASHLLGR